MKKWFNKNAPAHPTEQLLRDLGCVFERLPRGWQVLGDLDISNRGLTVLPDLSTVSVRGNFSCASNQLTTLEGAPNAVEGDYRCNDNQLAWLRGAPNTVGGSFFCGKNRLTSLYEGPVMVGKIYSCGENPLGSLKYGPHFFESVESDFGVFRSDKEFPDPVAAAPAKRPAINWPRGFSL